MNAVSTKKNICISVNYMVPSSGDFNVIIICHNLSLTLHTKTVILKFKTLLTQLFCMGYIQPNTVKAANLNLLILVDKFMQKTK